MSRLDEVRQRANNPFRALVQGVAQVDEDRDYLLALVREQQAQIEKAEELGRRLQGNLPGDRLCAFDRGYAAGRRAAGGMIVAALTTTEDEK